MTTIDESTGAEPSSESVPFEVIPQLAANEIFVQKMTRLRELKEMHDQLFRKADEKKKDPGGEFERLKLECGAMALAAGAKSVTFYDLRMTNADGAVKEGELTGLALQDATEQPGVAPLTEEQYRIIALASLKLDVNKLVKRGIPVALIETARKLIPQKRNAASVRVEWIGKQRTGGGGSMQ